MEGGRSREGESIHRLFGGTGEVEGTLFSGLPFLHPSTNEKNLCNSLITYLKKLFSPSKSLVGIEKKDNNK